MADLSGLNFTAVDFELAAQNDASPCQVGVATFVDGELASQAGWLINPGMTFHWACMRIHKIRPKHVRDAPTIPDSYGRIRAALADQTVISHSLADRRITKAIQRRFKLAPFNAAWIDNLRVSRAAWPPPAQRHSLTALVEALGIGLEKPHDAVCDSVATGHVFVHAARKLIDEGKFKDARDLLKHYQIAFGPVEGRPGAGSRNASPKTFSRFAPPPLLLPQVDVGVLSGDDRVAFTGPFRTSWDELQRITNRVASAQPTVDDQTTVLVVGQHSKDGSPFRPHFCWRRRNAEIMREAGRNVRIMCEDDYLRLFGDSG